MQEMERELVIIGGGSAGIAAAVKAYNLGVKDILILEREPYLGGILPQCIHQGFGLGFFKDDLTGPEFAHRLIVQADEARIDRMLNTMVIEMTSDRDIYAVNEQHGVLHLKCGAIILAMGCRERARGAIALDGDRPTGIYTAGLAQKFVNIDGYLPGEEFVILGSGDIGLIMARRLTLEGAKVKAVLEIMPYPGGLTRNVVQCLMDYNIPLMLSTTVARIDGKDRVERILAHKVDSGGEAVKGSEFELSCDTLLLSVGLIPENELTRRAGLTMNPDTGGPKTNSLCETSAPGIFACGNVLHVHDLADNVAMEAERAAEGAWRYLTGQREKRQFLTTVAGMNVRYVMPNWIVPTETMVHMRVSTPMDDVALYIEGKRKRKLRAARPGEMITVKLKKEEIEAYNRKEVVFDVK